LRVVAFVYDFPHGKSSHGLLWLKSHGFHDVVCVATPFKVLNIPKSKTRVTPKIKALHPQDVARSFNYEYIQCDHDDLDISQHLNGDIGVVLGARRIKPHALCSIPIINMHPGVLPDNRGLDNLKWAIQDGIPQGVTTHFIDDQLDRGRLINVEIVDVFKDDTLLDIFIRTQTVELSEMIRALRRMCVDGIAIGGRQLGVGKYNKVMSDVNDELVLSKFDDYKNNYETIVRKYYERY
jgi:phosphoribosylglycinamide formyltransferase-1